MSKRPYMSKSITELETLFSQNAKDKAITAAILDELHNRTTQRAKSLKEKVQEAKKKAQTQSGQEQATVSHSSEQRTTETTQSRKSVVDAVQSENRGPAPQKPPILNKSEDILRAWTALEVLSPQTFRRETDLVGGDRSLLAWFDKTGLPWEPEEKSRPNKRLFYEVYIGTIEMAPAIEALLHVYTDKRVEMPSVKGHCPIATVIVDKTGRPLEEETSANIASFAWGVPVALRGDLHKLADWTQQNNELLKEFRNQLILRDKKSEIVPLTQGHIHGLYQYLVKKLNLENLPTKKPYFAIRKFEYFASKTPPESSLLNSFFLEDLAAARSLARNAKLPNGLLHYLGQKQAGVRIDLLKDTEGLKELLQPGLTPPGRWPGKGRFPLALLQQAAVNATEDEKLQTDILAVNGPPGTGKTTLLRDIVAARLIERATVMATYKNPADAFKPTNESFTRSGSKITLHRLDEQLKGFEMVVASSNNKAVENVSAELPSIEAIAEDATRLRYFKTISDNVFSRKTWGLIAAVLGNSSNRYQFSQSFWRDEERGLSTYLNHASGIPQIVTEPQEDGKQPIKRNRLIVDQETPPGNAREAIVRWEKAKSEFDSALKAFREHQSKLQAFYYDMVRVAQLKTTLATSKEDLAKEDERLTSLRYAFTSTLEELKTPSESLKAYNERKIIIGAERPGLLARLFRTAPFRNWYEEWVDLHAEIKRAETDIQSLNAKASNLRNTMNETEKLAAEINANIVSVLSQLEGTVEKIAREKPKLGVAIPDEAFFHGTHEDIHTGNVWFNKTSSKMRDDVFETAVLLHRAFIDCAANPLRQNLSIFVESFGTRSLGTFQKDALIPDLWSSMFLVVPVISTTFASVNRMFSRLEPETLGWLLVDEAGQALPQAAVGAMMRAKKTVVVGDPLQIEPVVSLPSSLTEEICLHFGVDPLLFNAPEASAQTLADAASSYSASFPSGSGYRDVGAPLLVHRRCNSPMFEISNEIAYSNLMVHAKQTVPDNHVLGHSKWINVVSQAGQSDKWFPAEGETLIDMLLALKRGGVKPDIYIITPFVVIQDNLRKQLLDSEILEGWVDKPREWISEHVGTVHTVQGREAEIVFFVLGAQAPSQNGARAWAGGNPNLVNVAVTRAKTSIYVIGNREAWKKAGHFSTLSRFLPG